jgi:hypothetical protein
MWRNWFCCGQTDDYLMHRRAIKQEKVKRITGATWNQLTVLDMTITRTILCNITPCTHASVEYEQYLRGKYCLWSHF